MKQVKEENDNQSASLLTSKWLHVQTIITHNALISADTIDGNSIMMHQISEDFNVFMKPESNVCIT